MDLTNYFGEADLEKCSYVVDIDVGKDEVEAGMAVLGPLQGYIHLERGLQRKYRLVVPLHSSHLSQSRSSSIGKGLHCYQETSMKVDGRGRAWRGGI